MKQLNNIKDKSIILLVILASLVDIVIGHGALITNLFILSMCLMVYTMYNFNIRKNTYFCVLILSMVGYNLKLEVLGIKVDYFIIALGIYYLFLFIDILKRKVNFNLKYMVSNRYTIFLTIFIVYMLISVVWSVNKGQALVGISRYAVMIGIMIMCVTENTNKEEFKSTMRVLLIGYFLILLVGLIQMFAVDLGVRTKFPEIANPASVPENLKFQLHIPVSFFYNPNDFAFVIGVALALLFGKVFCAEDIKEKIGLYLIIILSIVEMIFTSSRTGWIALYIILGMGLLVFLVSKNKKGIINAIIGIVITVILFGGLSKIPFMEPFYGKIKSAPNVQEITQIIKDDNANNSTEVKQEEESIFTKDHSIGVRSALIYDVYKGVILEKHLMGFGVNNSGTYILTQDNTAGITNVHNFWMEVLGDYGVGIFIYMIVICISIFAKLIANYYLALKKKTRNLGVQVGGIIECVAIALLVFTPSSVVAFAPFWICISLIYIIATRRNVIEKLY